MRLAPQASRYFLWSGFSHGVFLLIFYVLIFLLHTKSTIHVIVHSNGVRSDVDISLTVVSLIFFIFIISDFLCVYLYSDALAKRYEYELTPDGISLQKGIFNQTHERMPYAKVQDVLVQSTILMRMFGLASVTVQNAAVMGFNNSRSGNARNTGMVIPALEAAVAEQLRNDILAHVNKAGQQPL